METYEVRWHSAPGETWENVYAGTEIDTLETTEEAVCFLRQALVDHEPDEPSYARGEYCVWDADEQCVVLREDEIRYDDDA